MRNLNTITNLHTYPRATDFHLLMFQILDSVDLLPQRRCTTPGAAIPDLHLFGLWGSFEDHGEEVTKVFYDNFRTFGVE